MKAQRAKLSRNDDLAKAFDYLLNRWPAFTFFLDDRRVCLSNNAAERALRGIALGRNYVKHRIMRSFTTPRPNVGRPSTVFSWRRDHSFT